MATKKAAPAPKKNNPPPKSAGAKAESGKGGGGNNNNNNNNKSSSSGMKNGTPTTQKLQSLQNKGLSAQQIVKKYGGKSGLSAHDLDVLGFSNKAIKSAKGRLPNNPYTGGRGNSGGGGNGIGGDNFPSLEEYLGSDPYYQQGLSELMLNMDQFGIQNDAAEGDINSLFELTLQRLQKERDRSLVDITDDFGARGLVNSGLYGKGMSDYNDAFADRVYDLNRDRGIQLRNLGFEESNFEGLNDSKQNELRLDAIRRRAEELGSRVGSGFGAAGSQKPAKKTGTKKSTTKKSAPKSKNYASAIKSAAATKGKGWNYSVPKPAVAKPKLQAPKSGGIKNPVRPGVGKKYIR